MKNINYPNEVVGYDNILTFSGPRTLLYIWLPLHVGNLEP